MNRFLIIFILSYSQSLCEAVLSTKLKMIVPIYIGPYGPKKLSYWKYATEAASKVNVLAIVNPNNGPSDISADVNYMNVLINMKRNYKKYAGSLMVGYISTKNANRPINEIEADIRKYLNWPIEYRVDGIYLDKYSNDPSHMTYYEQLYKLAKGLFNNTNSAVVTSPGKSFQTETFCSEGYKNNSCKGKRITDVAVVFEGSYADWQKHTFSHFIKTRKSSKKEFAVMVHSCPKDRVKEVVRKAMASNIGYVYATDEVKRFEDDYLWDEFPSYFNIEVQEIQKVY